MNSSRIFITIFLTISIAIITSASAPCDKNGQCKYGGVCGSNGKCICQMNCISNWEINANSLYCRPGGGILFNICHVMNEACELQQDIPLIKYDITKRRQCAVENAKKEKLCPAPEDFMGPCGGTIDRRESYEAGVCLKHRETGERRCECPRGKQGWNCDIKRVVYLSVAKATTTHPDGIISDNILGAGIGAAIVAGLLLMVFICALLRYRRRTQPRNGEKQKCGSPKIISDSSNNRHQSSRTDKTHTSGAESAEQHCSIAIPALEENKTALASAFTSEDFENLAAENRPSKRQRLTGISGDANNNFGDSQSRKYESQFSRIRESKSTPQIQLCIANGNSFCEGLSEESCINNSVHSF